MASRSSGGRSELAGSSRSPVVVGTMSDPRASGSNSETTRVRRSQSPRNSRPTPTGQFIGAAAIPSTRSISPRTPSRSVPGRSSLLTNVRIGIPRRAQTWKSFSVCGSTPFVASSTITALSAAIRVR